VDHTYVDAKNIKSLEDLMLNLVSEIATLKTLEATQLRALEIGIMKEDQMQLSSNMIDHLHKLIRLYFYQAESVASLLPSEFSVEEISKKLREAHLRKARQLTRKKKDE